MNCIQCSANFEPKVKFCSSKCRVSHFRGAKSNAIVTPVTTSLQGNVPDWAKNILKPKEVPIEKIVEEGIKYVEDDAL